MLSVRTRPALCHFLRLCSTSSVTDPVSEPKISSRRRRKLVQEDDQDGGGASKLPRSGGVSSPPCSLQSGDGAVEAMRKDSVSSKLQKTSRSDWTGSSAGTADGGSSSSAEVVKKDLGSGGSSQLQNLLSHWGAPQPRELPASDQSSFRSNWQRDLKGVAGGSSGSFGGGSRADFVAEVEGDSAGDFGEVFNEFPDSEQLDDSVLTRARRRKPKKYERQLAFKESRREEAENGSEGEEEVEGRYVGGLFLPRRNGRYDRSSGHRSSLNDDEVTRKSNNRRPPEYDDSRLFRITRDKRSAGFDDSRLFRNSQNRRSPDYDDDRSFRNNREKRYPEYDDDRSFRNSLDRRFAGFDGGSREQVRRFRGAEVEFRPRREQAESGWTEHDRSPRGVSGRGRNTSQDPSQGQDGPRERQGVSSEGANFSSRYLADYTRHLAGLNKRDRKKLRVGDIRGDSDCASGGDMLSGPHVVGMALRSPHRHLRRVFYQRNPSPRVIGLLERCAELGVSTEPRTAVELDAISRGTGVHQGVCALADPLRAHDVDELLACLEEHSGAPLTWVMVDRVQDPMNLGSLLRTCFFMGVDNVLMSAINSCRLSSTVSRASSGVMEIFPVHTIAEQRYEEMFDRLRQLDWQLLASTCSKQAEEAPYVDRSRNTLLVVGNEGKGIDPFLLERCTSVCVDPGRQLPEGVDSLNVAVATGILLSRLRGTGA